MNFYLLPQMTVFPNWGLFIKERISFERSKSFFLRAYPVVKGGKNECGRVASTGNNTRPL